MRSTWYLWLVFPLVAGCAKPAGIEIEGAAPAAIYDTEAFPLHAYAVDKTGKPMNRVELTYSADGNILKAEGNRSFKCLATGKGRITVSCANDITRDVIIHCWIITRITTPPRLQLETGETPVAFEARAYAGSVLVPEPPLEVQSSDESIVRYEDGKVRPVAVGRAFLTASSGPSSSTTEVEVGEEFLSEAFALPDGESRPWTIPAGEYLVKIQVSAANGSGNGATISWIGAFCENQPERQHHEVRCAVEGEGILMVKNPSLFDAVSFGPALLGRVKITRVPAGGAGSN